MSDHTPGSWKVSECRRGKLGAPPNEHESYLEIRSDFYGAGTIKNGPEATICEISLYPQTAVDCGGSGFCHVTDPKANAHLIAAAPDLLKACVLATAQINYLHTESMTQGARTFTEPMVSKAQKILRDAIAKATIETSVQQK